MLNCRREKGEKVRVTQWAHLVTRKNREAAAQLTHLHNQYVLMTACWGEKRGRGTNIIPGEQVSYNKLLCILIKHTHSKITAAQMRTSEGGLTCIAGFFGTA